LIVFAEGGDARAWYRLTGPYDPNQSPQPTNIDGSSVEPFSEGYFPKSQYNFVAAGRFVYFCNGIGALWEVEILKPTNKSVGTSDNQGDNFNVRSNVFERRQPASCYVVSFERSKTYHIFLFL
jgi:hypothetical protein